MFCTRDEAISDAEEATDALPVATDPPRKGHKTNFTQNQRLPRIENQAKARLNAVGTPSIKLVDVLLPESDFKSPDAFDAQDCFLGYVVKRMAQMKYLQLQSRGIQIGSGAMAFLHESASHMRLKKSVVPCLGGTSQAILNWGMLRLSGR